MYEIEKNVAIASRVGVINKYPLSEMEIGDSFVISAPTSKRIQLSIYSCAKNKKMKVVTRFLADGSIRVWRVK